MRDHAQARKKMVEQQLKARGIRDPRVLRAMEEVPRHLFVPPESIEAAYDDNPLSIGNGQTISQPYMVAIMTELLELQHGEKVLEIGTGSGYQTAVLATLCMKVFTIERINQLSQNARKVLTACGFKNVTFMVGDGSGGWSSEAPFDGIIVTAGAPRVPEILIEQLAEGGRLVIPVGDRFSQVLELVRKVATMIKVERHTPCRFVDLVGQHGWTG